MLKPETSLARSNPTGEAPATLKRDSRADPDSLWVEQARAGDHAAFRWLVDRHRDRAYGLALRILRSEPDAEEVAQDAFVRVWRALPRFRGEAAFATWLYRIVVRQAFDRAACLKGRRAREASLGEEIAERPDPGVDADEGARERARKLERLIDALTEVQRAVITLYYAHDRSVEETSKILMMPENTVKTHLSRARSALREGWMRDASARAASKEHR